MKNETEIIYDKIECKVLNHEMYQKVKDYSKAKEKMKTYLEIGELLSCIDTKYGKSVIKEYSNRLITKFGKRYSVSLLYKIKQFYLIIQKVLTLSGKLTWSHWYEMLSIDDINKIKYYVYQCEINNIDVRGLRSIIKSNEYERLNEKTKLKIINGEDDKRLYQRILTRKDNSSLNKTTIKSVVRNLSKFHNSVYRKLYNNETANSRKKN